MANVSALPAEKANLLGLLKKKRTQMYRICTQLQKETLMEGYSSERWNKLA
jgi:hypothetical protein